MSPSGNALTVERPQTTAAWPAAVGTTRARGARLAGMAIGVDLSWVIGIALTTWTFAAGFLPETDPGRATGAYWGAGVVGALLVGASILLHELGHALAARRAGLGVARITLSFVGGTAQIVGTVRRPAEELLIALGGPLASLATMLAAAIAHVVIVETRGPGLAASVAALIAVANLAVALLNAVPGLPLDGGRALRAVAWAATGRYESATRLATALGRRIGEVTIGIAIVASAFGFLAFAMWAALLGFILREQS
ncbi:MAG TPA: site-2 protease family protein [Terriglobales bacterium]|nr:site-2 protease family protein [Terriglobales bacterium]